MDLIQKTVDYFRSSKAELVKVTWPSKQDTIRYSSLVIVASVALALFFAVLDRGLIDVVKYAITHRTATTQTAAPAATQPITTSPVEVQTTGDNNSAVEVQTVPLDEKAPAAVPTTPTTK